jgi:hypothetical protein
MALILLLLLLLLLIIIIIITIFMIVILPRLSIYNAGYRYFLKPSIRNKWGDHLSALFRRTRTADQLVSAVN